MVRPKAYCRDLDGRIPARQGSSTCRQCNVTVRYDFHTALRGHAGEPIDWETNCWQCGSQVDVLGDSDDHPCLEGWEERPASSLTRHAYCESCEEGRTMYPKDIIERSRSVAERHRQPGTA